MTIKRLNAVLLAAAAVLLLLSGCGKKEAAETVSAVPDRMPPVEQSKLAIPGEVPDPSAELAALMDAAPSEEPEAKPEEPVSRPSGELAPAAMPEPTAEPAPTPAATPTPSPVPPPVLTVPAAAPAQTAEPAAATELRPGVYEGADGSILTVKEDGTCTLVTAVSGKVNGKAMSADLTFHGTVEAGEFSFDKVTYGAIDLTAIAAAAGYTDASAWETIAELIYAAG